MGAWYNCCCGCQFFFDNFTADPFEEGTRYSIEDPDDWTWVDANNWIVCNGGGPLHFGTQAWNTACNVTIPSGGSVTLSAGSGGFFDLTREQNYVSGRNQIVYKLNGNLIYQLTGSLAAPASVTEDVSAAFQKIIDDYYSFQLGNFSYEFSRTQTWDWTISATSGVLIRNLRASKIDPDCYQSCGPAWLQEPGAAPGSINITGLTLSGTDFDNSAYGTWTYYADVPASVAIRTNSASNPYAGTGGVTSCGHNRAPIGGCINTNTHDLFNCRWSFTIGDTIYPSGSATFVGVDWTCDDSYTPLTVGWGWTIQFMIDYPGVLGGNPHDVWLLVCGSVGIWGTESPCGLFLPTDEPGSLCGNVNLGGRVDWSSLNEEVTLYKTSDGSSVGTITVSS